MGLVCESKVSHRERLGCQVLENDEYKIVGELVI